MLVDLKQGSRVLDVGCGSGLLLKKLSSQMSKNTLLVGIDSNRWLVRESAKSSTRASVICADAFYIPIRTNTFDYCFLIDVIEHVKRPRELLGGVRRVMKRGGYLIVNTPDKLSLVSSPTAGGERFVNFIIQTIRFNLLRLLGKAFVDLTHVREYTVIEIYRVVQLSGFHVIYINGLFKRLLPFMPKGSIKILCQKP